MKRDLLHIFIMLSICIVGLMFTAGCGAFNMCGNCTRNVLCTTCEGSCKTCIACYSCSGCAAYCSGCIGIS